MAGETVMNGIVTVCALLTTGVFAWAGREVVSYARTVSEESTKARETAEKALRHLKGEDPETEGLIHEVQRHRRVLYEHGLLPVESDGEMLRGGSQEPDEEQYA